MIVFWTTRKNSDPIIGNMAALAGSATERASLHYCYEDYLDADQARWQGLPCGVHVFTDIEFLEDEAAQQVAALHAFLSEKNRALNQPSKSLKRFELHRTLHAQGINQFQSFAAKQFSMVDLRFPVFMRRANDHRGSQTGLLSTPDAVLRQIEYLTRGGEALDDWIITEFVETADSSGLRHKYAAFSIGGRIVPRHLFFSAEWIIKEPDRSSALLMKEERAYLQANPHREELEYIFALANIQYGRVDYSLVDGRLQIWEINTNPMIFRPSHWWGPRAVHHRLVAAGLEQAWCEMGALEPVSGRWIADVWKTMPARRWFLAKEFIKHALRKVGLRE